LKPHKTPIRPTITYGSQTFDSDKVTNGVRIFERKAVKKIYGPARVEERRSIRTDYERGRTLRIECILKCIKSLQGGMVMLKKCTAKERQNPITTAPMKRNKEKRED